MFDPFPTGKTQEEAVKSCIATAKKMGYIPSKKRVGDEIRVTIRMPLNWWDQIWFRVLAVVGR